MLVFLQRKSGSLSAIAGAIMGKESRLENEQEEIHRRKGGQSVGCNKDATDKGLDRGWCWDSD